MPEMPDIVLPHCAQNSLVVSRSTNTPTAVTTPCLTRRESGSLKMPEKPTPAPCRTSSCSAADFLARLSALQDPEKDSEIRAALSSLNWPAWLKPGSLRICCLKMYPACYLMTEGGRLRRSSTRWTDWGMAWNGNVLTAKISAFPSQETACTLSDILMSDVQQFIREQKRPDYFL